MDKSRLHNTNKKVSSAAVRMSNLVNSKQAIVVQNNMRGNFPSSSDQSRRRMSDYTTQDRKVKQKLIEMDFFSKEKKKSPQFASKQETVLPVPNIKEDDITLKIGLECIECGEEDKLSNEQVKKMIEELNTIKLENESLQEENTKLRQVTRGNNIKQEYNRLSKDYIRLSGAYNQLKSDYKNIYTRRM